MGIIITLLVILVVGIVVQNIPMNATLKNIAYLILGIAVVVTVLRLIGVDVPAIV